MVTWMRCWCRSPMLAFYRLKRSIKNDTKFLDNELSNTKIGDSRLEKY